MFELFVVLYLVSIAWCLYQSKKLMLAGYLSVRSYEDDDQEHLPENVVFGAMWAVLCFLSLIPIMNIVGVIEISREKFESEKKGS